MISPAEILQGNILIVDDQRSDVVLLTEMLRGAGYARVSSTMDTLAVCALHRENHYDLILLDLEMPRMDGFAVMDGLKSIESDGYLPVIAVTAESARFILLLWHISGRAGKNVFRIAQRGELNA